MDGDKKMDDNWLTDGDKKLADDWIKGQIQVENTDLQMGMNGNWQVDEDWMVDGGLKGRSW